jgi:hypothetical protein
VGKGRDRSGNAATIRFSQPTAVPFSQPTTRQNEPENGEHNGESVNGCCTIVGLSRIAWAFTQVNNPIINPLVLGLFEP